MKLNFRNITCNGWSRRRDKILKIQSASSEGARGLNGSVCERETWEFSPAVNPRGECPAECWHDATCKWGGGQCGPVKG